MFRPDSLCSLADFVLCWHARRALTSLLQAAMNTFAAIFLYHSHNRIRKKHSERGSGSVAQVSCKSMSVTLPLLGISGRS